MTYQETIDYLYHAAPMFQNIGAGAYKEGLTTTRTLDEHFQHPHHSYHTIHVAGTNGKGSVSSTLASVLQCAGFKVGLYTSPHLIDFRERIRVNGEMIPEQRVVDFIEKERPFFEPLSPSFFELTTALAFLYFQELKVDVAVIEVGLGGRLDCTNIITPDLSVITNISFDHTQFLGNTLAQIASEKAGIMKAGIPVVVGESKQQPEVYEVMRTTAERLHCPIRYADTEHHTLASFALTGHYQQRNIPTILCALDTLSKQPFYNHLPAHIEEGFSRVCELTGIRGRWELLHEHPRVICDVGHNVAGITQVAAQLRQEHYRTLRIVFGMVDDKDYRSALALLPHDAVYYFTQPSCHRALPATTLAATAAELGLQSTSSPVPCPSAQVLTALHDADPEDLIFIGGSCYLVADILKTPLF